MEDSPQHQNDPPEPLFDELDYTMLRFDPNQIEDPRKDQFISEQLHSARLIINELVEFAIIPAEYEKYYDRASKDYFKGPSKIPLGYLEAEVYGLTAPNSIDNQVKKYRNKLELAQDIMRSKVMDRAGLQPLLLALDYLYPPEENEKDVASMDESDLEIELFYIKPEQDVSNLFSNWKDDIGYYEAREDVFRMGELEIVHLFEDYGIVHDDVGKIAKNTSRQIIRLAFVSVLRQSLGQAENVYGESLESDIDRFEQFATMTIDINLTSLKTDDNQDRLEAFVKSLRREALAIVKSGIFYHKTRHENGLSGDDSSPDM